MNMRKFRKMSFKRGDIVIFEDKRAKRWKSGVIQVVEETDDNDFRIYLEGFLVSYSPKNILNIRIISLRELTDLYNQLSDCV